MQRRKFLEGSFAGGMMMADRTPGARELENNGSGSVSYDMEIVVEKKQPGKPHKGKMLAAIQPHCDDIPILAGGTVLKLLDEGYEGILITMSDDSMAGEGKTYGEIVQKNERDTFEVARRLGLKEALFLNYPNHNMDAWPIVEIRARLAFIFRAYKIDTVLVYDPAQLYERNPDHYVTASAVEAACWMAGSEWDYPEHFKAGLKPHAPQEKYYFARGPQLVNRVVDTSDYVEGKINANMANVTQGPGGDLGARLRRKLAAEGRKLPLLGDSDDSANRAYIRQFTLARDRLRGKKYGLAYAEYFHYIPRDESDIEEYVKRNAVKL